jgi:predicted DNA-binding transcriptional regulator AlpA
MLPAFNSDPLLTASELCSVLRVSRATLNRLMNKGTIKPVNCGLSVLRFRQSSVTALVNGQAEIKARNPGKRPGRPRLYLSADEVLAS